VTDYFDRLALDRALDSIGESERRLTAEMVGERRHRPEAVEAWVAARRRGRAHPRGGARIASSGLTLSKLSVRGEPARRPGEAVPAVVPHAGDEQRRPFPCPPRAIVRLGAVPTGPAQPYFTLIINFVYAPYFASAIRVPIGARAGAVGLWRTCGGRLHGRRRLSPVPCAIADASAAARSLGSRQFTVLVVIPDRRCYWPRQARAKDR
jgi:hypothetical protein